MGQRWRGLTPATAQENAPMRIARAIAVTLQVAALAATAWLAFILLFSL